VTVRIAVVGDENDTLASHREHDVPFLGTCGGRQYAVIEYSRNVLGVSDASHAESDGVQQSNVIAALAGKPVHPLLGEFVRCARAYAGQAVAGEASSSASS
jgi:CTP synthase (UTP-ammonia lyase)